MSSSSRPTMRTTRSRDIQESPADVERGVNSDLKRAIGLYATDDLEANNSKRAYLEEAWTKSKDAFLKVRGSNSHTKLFPHWIEEKIAPQVYRDVLDQLYQIPSVKAKYPDGPKDMKKEMLEADDEYHHWHRVALFYGRVVLETPLVVGAIWRHCQESHKPHGEAFVDLYQQALAVREARLRNQGTSTAFDGFVREYDESGSERFEYSDVTTAFARRAKRASPKQQQQNREEGSQRNRHDQAEAEIQVEPEDQLQDEFQAQRIQLRVPSPPTTPSPDADSEQKEQPDPCMQVNTPAATPDFQAGPEQRRHKRSLSSSSRTILANDSDNEVAGPEKPGRSRAALLGLGQSSMSASTGPRPAKRSKPSPPPGRQDRLEDGGWLTDEHIDEAISRLTSCSGTTATVSCLLWECESPDPVAKAAFAEPVKDVVLPCNVNGNHWFLLHFDVMAKQVRYLDSYPGLDDATAKANKVAREFVSRWLPDGHWDDWTVEQVRCAEQSNTFDCGVYTVAFAAYIVAEEELPEQINGDVWRAVMRALSRGTTLAEQLKSQVGPEQETLRRTFATELGKMAHILHKLQAKGMSEYAIVNAQWQFIDMQCRALDAQWPALVEDIKLFETTRALLRGAPPVSSNTDAHENSLLACKAEWDAARRAKGHRRDHLRSMCQALEGLHLQTFIFML